MKNRLCLLLTVCIGFCFIAMNPYSITAAQSSKLPLLLVVNQGDASLSLVDPDRNKQVATIIEGVPSTIGHEIAVSPDGLYAYMPLYGNAGVGKPGTDGRLILVFDIADKKVIGQIDLGRGVRPHCILYDRSSNLLYLTTELDQTVTVVDPKTRKVVGTIPTNQDESHMLAISHDGRRGYTANVGPGTVSVLDLVKRRFIKTIPISRTTQRISISNDDRWVFTADQIKPRLAVIDTKTNEVKSWLPLPSLGYGSASTKDGRWLLVTLPIAGELAVIDLQTMTVVRTIEIGLRPQEVLVRPDGLVAYVSCFGGNQVAVVNLAQWRVQTMINVGKRADGMAWASANR